MNLSILVTIVTMGKINMKTKLLFIYGVLILASGTSYACNVMSKEEILEKLSSERYFPYQDIMINNEVIFKGVGPDCPSRYEAIKAALAEYKRPIKVLDIGASNGYFSLRLAKDFEATCVMADLSDRLANICKFNTEVRNLIYLKRALSLEDLQLLAKHEHFDVVLALNVLHHMSPWKEITDVIFELGDTVIIETPPFNDKRAEKEPSIPFIEKYLLSRQDGEVITETPRAAPNNFDHIVVSLNAEDDVLSKKEFTPDAYAKMFCFRNKQSTNTLSFNQEIFQTLNGVFPEKNN